MANNSSLSKYRKQKAANSVLSKYKEQKKEQEENDITLNTSDDSFTLSKYREMKKNNQINYDTDIINRYFTNSSNYINDVQNNISNPSYSWAKTYSDSETYGNIKNDSDYVRLYIDSLKGTEDYDSLKKQYDDYNNALSQYNDAAKQANEFASLFPDEEHYKKAIGNIKNSESDFEKSSKYAAYMDKDSSTIDEKKILDYFSNANNNLSDPQNFISKSQNNYNGNEILKYWETQDRLRNMQNVDTVPTESQVAQYQEDSDMLFNQSMEEKYKNKSGADEYDYDKLMEAYNSTDNYREKEWLLEKSEEVGSSEELQKRYDELQSQYNADYEAIMNSDKSDESKAQEVAKLNEKSPDLKDLKDQIESKKYEEKKKSEYDDVVANDVKAKTIMQKYYYLEKYDEIQKMLNSTGHGIESIKVKSSLDAYNFADKLTNQEKEQIRKDFNSLKNKDTLYKYYKREREEQETAEENQILIDYSDEHPVLGSLASVALNTYGSVGDTVEYVGAGVDKAFGGDGYINPDSTNVAKAQLIRENVSEDMGDVGKFLYNTGMSIGDTVARMPLLALPGGKAMSLSMGGTSSAVSWANDVINSGGSLDDALLTGAAAGAAEIIFEKIPLDNLIKLKNEGTESVWKAVAKQMSIEGMEEAGTDIANAITDRIINGDMSQLALQYQNYLDQGYTESEAWHNTAVDFAMQVGQSFAGGALSGGVLSGGALGANYATNKIGNSKTATNIKSGKAIKENENVNSLIESAKKLSADSKAYKLAEQLEERQKNNKNISSSKVGQLRSLILEQSQTEYDDTYTKTTQNLHDDEKAIVDKLIRGEALSNDEVKILSDNDVLKNSIADLREKQDSLYKSKLNAAFSPFEIIGDNTDKIDESKLNVSDNGKTQINNKEYDGPMEVVKTNPTAGTVTYKIEKDGKSIEVNSDDVQFKSKEEAKLNALASKYNVQTAQKFLDLYENGQNVNEYSEEFDLYQGYGKLATELTDDKLNKGYLLNNEQKIGAYEVGLNSRKSYYQQQNIIADNAKNSKYYAYTKGKFNASAIKDMKLNDTQRAFYDFFREFALRTGINIELFASEDAYGKYQGEQGSWDKNTKTVRIDINAGLKSVDEKGKIKHGMLNTFAHELTHIAEEGNYYDELHKAVVAALEKSSRKSYDELVESKKDELIRSVPNAKAMSDERFTYLADVEVIADACETMLKDSKIFEDIAKGNPTLAQKLRDALKNFIERLKQLLNKINALTSEGKFLEECVDEYEGILNLWDKAVTDGIKTVNAVEAEQKNNTANNGVRYQLRSYSEKQINNWSNSKNIVIYENDRQLSVFVDNAIAGRNLNQKMYFGIVDQELANRIYNDTSVNVEGFNVVLRASEIRKILLHSHGNEAKENSRGQRAITKQDILLIPKIIAEPDKIINAGHTKSNKPAIAFEKTIKGKTTVLSYVSDKHMDLTVQTMYSGKEKSLPTTADAKSPAPTSETNSGTASNNSISNAAANVNKDYTDILQEDTLKQHNDDSSSKDKSVLYQFGGRKAATANQSLLDQAIEMEDSGKDSETIRQKTGWFKSYDGKWRFEIDDSEMQFKSAAKEDKEKVLAYKKKVLRRMDLRNDILNNTATAEEKREYNDIEKYISEYETSKKLDDYVTHPKLFEAYPQLKDVSLYFDILVPNTAAKYYPDSNKIMINAARSYKEQKQSVIHEIQHIIQGIEGFAGGSSMEHWLTKGADKRTAYNNYIDTAGEIEARDSASRHNLNAEQRKNTRPDIDRLAQDVVFAEDEEKVSVGNTTDNTSDIRYQARNTKSDYNFSRALNKKEWASFYASLEKSNQRNSFRIGDNGILIPDENNSKNYKLVCYEGDSSVPYITAVYKLENYDYNIHEKQLDFETVLDELRRYDKNDELAKTILGNYSILSGTVFRRYDRKSGKFISITQKRDKNLQHNSIESDRTGVSQDVGQGVSDRIIEDDNPQFQMRPDGGFSNRMLLAETLEKAAKNQLEKNKVSVYKQAVEQIAELETRLNDVNQKIKKVSSVKAAERTREQRTELMKLNNVKKVLQDKVVRKDRQLLNLEAMDTIKNLIEAEKKKAVHEARVSREATLKEIQEKHDKAMSAEKEKNRERLAEVSKRKDKIIIAEREKRRTMVKGVRDARDKKENIRKIKKSLKDIAKLLNRSKVEKTVKQGLRDTASKMLELSDVLFDTDLSNADIVRRGVEAATPEEQKLLNEYLSLIGETDTELTESQRRKVYQLNSKLKDLFIRERERLNKATVEQSLTQLSESYKSTKNAKENYIRNAFDENIIDAIDNFKDEIGGTLVKDMTVNQTEELRKIVTMMLTSIRKANKIHAENINSDYEQTSIDVINEILNVKDTKELRNIISQKLTDFQWRNFKPVYAFRFIGSKTFEKLFWNLQKGELKWRIDIDEAKKFKDNCEKQYNYKSFDFKKKLEFEAADGSAFTLDLNQMMDIYAASRRPQALQHLLKGGFTFEKDSADGKLKVKTGAKAYPLTVSTIQSIADILSENEKGYAESMQKYLSEVMAKKGNEVSMALYGVELFNEDTYWSITSSDVFLQIEESETTGEFKLKKAPFTKSTARNASNPIVLKGFEENWCNHVNQMSLYHALTLPLEDLTKVFNYNTGVKSNEEHSTAVTGVRSVIKGAFGNSAESYIKQFLRSINGGIREASRVGIADNLISLSKKASVFANFSVFIQQPTAILRALAYVDARYFLPEPNKLIRVQNYRKDWEQLKKYAPVAGIKEMGMFDTGTGKGVLEWLSSGQRDSVVKKTRNKIDDIGSWLPEMADKFAWIKLWHAIQRETRAKYGLKIGTEENLVKSGERFNEIVELTQVYDSVFSRSGAMRSSQTFDKIATSYMAEPTTEMNMAVDAVVQLKRSGKAGIKQFAKTISAILISKFANTLLKSIVFAGRDDDEDETYSDKYWQAVKDDLLGWGSSLNPLNYYPIMRDIMSVIEGYTTERMDMSLVSDLVISIKRLMKEDGTTTDNITDFIGYIANLFGLPVRNVVRDIKAAFNTYDTLTTASKDPITSLELSIPTAYQEAYDKYWEDGYTANECRKKAITSVKSKISKKLKPVYLEALKNQDSKTVRNIRQYMNNSGFYKSLNDVDDILKGWRENSDEEEKRAQRAEKRK